MPLSVSTPVVALKVGVIPVWFVQLRRSVFGWCDPLAIVTVPDASVGESGSVTVSALSTVVKSAFSAYAALPGVVFTAGLSLVGVIETVLRTPALLASPS